MSLNWKKIGGRLRKVSVGGHNVWGVNAEQNIWRFNGNSWDCIEGAAVQISVSSDGTVWCVNGCNEVFSWNGHTWTLVANIALTYVSVGSSSNVWGVNKEQEILNWNGVAWTKVAGKAVQISAGEDGAVWYVNEGTEIFKRNGVSGHWEKVKGSLTVVSCHDALSVIGNNSDGEVWIWNGQTWIKAEGQIIDISTGSAGNKHVWGVNMVGDVWRHVSEASTKIEKEKEAIIWEGRLKEAEELNKKAEKDYKTVQMQLQQTIVKSASAIIQAQLELCKEIVTLEIERAKLKTQALITAQVFLVTDKETGKILAEQAAMMPNPLTAEQCLLKFKEYLLICPGQFELILNAGKQAGLLTDDQVKQIQQ